MPPDFEADPQAVYAFVERFFAALAGSGVEHVCLSPGSRSTPLAVAAARTPGIRTWVDLDERSAGFFALGLAKQSGRPAALVCTSGTAAANYLPAVVEAHHAGVPLIACTADRPPELRGWGAGQTIDQLGLYGRNVRWFVEVPVPEGGARPLAYAERLAARAVDETQGPRRGPVHLNFPFREPLAPPPGSPLAPASAGGARLAFSRAGASAPEDAIDALEEIARNHSRGWISCGPLDPPFDLVAALAGFARVTGWPILADPASQLRGHPALREVCVVTLGEALLRSPAFARHVQPDVVLRLGEAPVSKAQRLALEAAAPDHVWWLDEGTGWGEPSHAATRVVRGGAAGLLAEVAARLEGEARKPSELSEAFGRAQARAAACLAAAGASDDAVAGISVAARSLAGLPDDAVIFASNSMAIRLLDLVQTGASGPRRVLCNRGANGIDGVTSTAFGVAAAHAGPTLLLTGDLALLHDLTGLMRARAAGIDLVIVCLDDDGGGIFSFLPIAAQGEAVNFERLFGTPHGLDLAGVSTLFDLGHARVESLTAFDAALAAARARGGVHLIHVPLDRDRNAARYRDLLGELVEVATQVAEGAEA